MKKRNITALAAAMLCACTLMAACGPLKAPTGDQNTNTEKPAQSLIEEVYRTEWTQKVPNVVSYQEIAVAGSYDSERSNKNFSVFIETLGARDLTTRVYSHYTNQIVATLTDHAETRYFVTCPDSQKGNVILVLELDRDASYYGTQSTLFGTSVSIDTAWKISLYDAAFHLLATSSPAVTAQYGNSVDQYCEEQIGLYADLFRFEQKAYAENADGTVTLVKNFDLVGIPTVTHTQNGYYYQMSDRAFTAYDGQFGYLSHYEVPSYAMNTGLFLLNNGNVLAQYRVRLPDEADDYDLFVNGTKYDLVSKIVTVANGAVTDVELSFVVKALYTVSALNETQFNSENCFSDGVENLAMLIHMDDAKALNETTSATECVLLSNEANVVKSLKMSADLVGIPYPIGNGYFVCQTVSGAMAIYDVKANRVMTLHAANAMPLGNNWITEKAIYDMSGAVVYDLLATQAEIVGTHGAIAYLTEVRDGVRTVSVFANGAVTPLGTLSGDGATFDSFVCYGSYYYTYKTGGKHTYYNANGQAILETDRALTALGDCRGGVLLTDGAGHYYKLNYDVIV